MASASQFCFTVPDGVTPGATTLKLTASDGVDLSIPVPANVLSGDTVYMTKAADGWSISKVTRTVREAVPAVSATWQSDEDLCCALASPEAVAVQLETTKGPIVLKVVPAWAPRGAARFLEMVDDGFYTDICVYRGIPGFLVQFGVVQAGDRRSLYPPLADDPLVGVPYAEGMLGFAAAGPGTRKATLCLFLGDLRSQLGAKQPETPIGRVLPESMDTLRRLHTGYGDIPQCGGKGPNPIDLEERGNAYVRANFPLCDFITGAKRL